MKPTKRVVVTPYEVGDAVAFDAVDPVPLAMQKQWAKTMPQGQAWTARQSGEAGRVIACMGIFQERDGGFRAWAVAARGLPIVIWGELFMIVRRILDGSPARVIRATAGDRRQADCLERVGFQPHQVVEYPRPYVRLK